MAKKHTKGERIGSMNKFGYRLEIYENVIVLYDNEDPCKSVEMQRHTFQDFIKYYKEMITP